MTDEEKRPLSEFLPQLEVDRFALAGIALSHVQSVERIIHHVLIFVLNEDPWGMRILHAQTEVDRKRTLGYFLAQLRKRVGIREDLDAKLGSFLERRNTLAHRMQEIPGWEGKTAEAYMASRRFLLGLTRDSHELLMLFAALCLQWQRNAMPDAVLPHQDQIDHLAKNYVTELDDLFFRKV